MRTHQTRVLRGIHPNCVKGQGYGGLLIWRNERYSAAESSRLIWLDVYADHLLGGINVVTVLERFFSRRERRKLFMSWAGSASMWIKVNSYTL